MDTKNLKEIKINFNKGTWNPELHSIILEYNAKSPTGFSVRMVDVYTEPPINNLELAEKTLRKYKL